MNSDDSDIKKLTFKRRIPFARLKEIYDYGKNSTTDPEFVINFNARAEFIEQLYEEFSEYHNKIISLVNTDKEYEQQDTYRSTADKYLYGTRAIKQTLLQTVVSNATTSNITAPLNIKLPKINIPIFEGNVDLWPSFFDIFNQLVHHNPNISTIEKFRYFMTSLRGPPHNLVKNILLVDANYQIAYDKIVQKYQNKRRLATNYFNEIYFAPSSKYGNYLSLRSLLDTFSENLLALQALKFDTASWDFVMFNMLLQKTDDKLRTQFECEFSETELPTYDDLHNFLLKHCKGLETSQNTIINSAPTKNPVHNARSDKKPQSSSTYVASVPSHSQSSTSINCVGCSESHPLIKCAIFNKKTPHERLNFAKQHQLCINCLKFGHRVRQCKSTRCRSCGGNHHSMLHFLPKAHDEINPPIFSNIAEKHDEIPTQSASVQNLHLNASLHSTVLLSTAVVNIRDKFGNFKKVRVLLDTASMANFISENCVQNLGLSRRNASIPVEGIDSLKSVATKGISLCEIKPVETDAPCFKIEAIILPKICSEQPKILVNSLNWNHIKGLKLADPEFCIPGPIDVLLGAEIFPHIIGSGKIFGETGSPVALETIFGWILQGRTEVSSLACSSLMCSVALETSLNEILQTFWNTEHVTDEVISQLTSDEQQCEEKFVETVSRDETGRFTVSLPFKSEHIFFGDSYSQAFRRFRTLENRFIKNPELGIAYSDIIIEYLNKNYISEIPPLLENSDNSSVFYLPHHCIIKPDKATTKLRIVFDASAKGTSGCSLNDVLHSGPKLQQDLGHILFKFRTYPIVFVCDVTQMYLQILISPEHRDFQRFLWRFDPKEDIKEYRLNRITFGVASAPYLALRTLKELANRERENFPLASEVLNTSVYVDDCVCGADSLESALILKNELIALLKAGGFELRKWVSNHSTLLYNLPIESVQKILDFHNEGPQYIKVLGLRWDPSADSFFYSFSELSTKCTKRNILSQIARIFDPLGFLSPILLFAKHLMQLLWLSKCDWDDTPSKLIVQSWTEFKCQLPDISLMKIPRILFHAKPDFVELHGFCDASSIGYGCVVYFKAKTDHNEYKVVLISAKSKVSPLKTISIPRLELCGALLLSTLINIILTSYQDRYKFNSVNAWTDSQIVLAWLNDSPHRWQTFVANRVSKIQRTLPGAIWRHISTDNNPADYASRGLLPLQLVSKKLWWNGPDILYTDEFAWPTEPPLMESLKSEIISEEKRSCLHIFTAEPSFLAKLTQKFSSLAKIINIVSYVIRGVKSMRKVNSKPTLQNILSSEEKEQALIVLVKDAQHNPFQEIFSCIENNHNLSKKYRKLAIFLDDAGVLRVGGRLANSSLSFCAKHPILLAKDQRLTELIIQKFHADHGHPGMKTLHNLLRQRFWIMSPKGAIHRCISKCIICFKSRPTITTPFMANLPNFRVNQVKAFTKVTLDYAGPFKITLGKYRGSKSSKAYICLFVCCTTKAIHLELASDLSTEAFLACFRRFTSRRGRVTDIYSDQGTNFIGASNQLNDIASNISNKLSLTWHFNPPGAPHFNGLSEAGVKSVKTHLFRIMGDQILNYEELYTLLTQIEALLNSRPLTALSDDPNDLIALTPGHFLTLEPPSSFPELDIPSDHVSIHNRWQLLNRMHCDFWTRWSKEYLHTLHQRVKWNRKTTNLKENDLVLLKDENLPPRSWLLARIILLHPGNDGIVRAVTIRTKNGTFQRPVVKLCPLPINNESSLTNN